MVRRYIVVMKWNSGLTRVDNDKSYMAPDGTYFYMKCCAHGASGKEIARAIQPTLQACMDYCASIDLCKG